MALSTDKFLGEQRCQLNRGHLRLNQGRVAVKYLSLKDSSLSTAM